MKYVKTPIRVRQGGWAGDIEDAKGTIICEMSEDEPFSMAQEIVLAVNAYDAMVAVCELAVEAVEYDLPGASELLLSSAKIILALVKGGTSE